MSVTLPDDVQQVLDRFITTEYTTIDAKGQPITWPVTPYFKPGAATVDVTTGLGYPKKANDARANPKVSLLFSEPKGSGLDGAPGVLIQGTAVVDEADLPANRDRYDREAAEKLPATKKMLPPKPIRRFAEWYFLRVYIDVPPERVYVWDGGDFAAEPAVLGDPAPPPAEGDSDVAATGVWDDRIDEMGRLYTSGVVAVVGADGFPFAVRAPVTADAKAGVVRIEGGKGLHAGQACLTVHDHAEDFTWQRNFQVRGALAQDGDGWVLVPHKLVGGFEIPEGSPLAKLRPNIAKARRFRKIAKRELAAVEARRAAGAPGTGL